MPLTTGLLLLPSHPAGRLAEIAQLAERSATTTCGWPTSASSARCTRRSRLCASARERIQLGPCVTDPYSRHAALTAMAIATLDEISGQRAVLGIGAGVSGFRELGVAREKSGVALREAVEVIRGLLAGETVTYKGEPSCGVDGAQLDFKPVRADVPMYIASQRAVGCRVGRAAWPTAPSCRAAWPSRSWPSSGTRVAAGAREAGRDPADDRPRGADQRLRRTTTGRPRGDLMKPTIVRSLSAQRPDFFTFTTAGLTMPARARQAARGAHLRV